jgi:hypothetical protein
MLDREPGQRPRSTTMDELFAMLAMDCRRKVVSSLMAGNDAGCFTTQQYLDAYVRVIDRETPSIMDLALAEKHLRSLGDEVREVRPGVWTTDQN